MAELKRRRPLAARTRGLLALNETRATSRVPSPVGGNVEGATSGNFRPWSNPVEYLFGPHVDLPTPSPASRAGGHAAAWHGSSTKLRQLSDQALAKKHFEVIKAWAKRLHAGADVGDVYAEYELRGLEPLALEHMPAGSDEAVQAMSEERASRIVREIFEVARKVEGEIN